MKTKEESIRFRIDPKEKEILKRKAEKSGLSLSKYIRSKLLNNYIHI